MSDRMKARIELEGNPVFTDLRMERDVLAEKTATLTAEAASLRAENERLRERHEDTLTTLQETAKAAIRAEARTRALEAALEFYANPESYLAIGFFPDHPCGEFIEDFEDTELGYKPGKRARAALTEPTPPAGEQG